MRHARKDYNRIQDLAEVCQWLSENLSYEDVKEIGRSGPEQIIRLLEERYQFDSETKPIPLNEPVFILRAQDECAPVVVAQWAAQVLQAGASEQICKKAMDWAHNEMLSWPVKQLPDLPE